MPDNQEMFVTDERLATTLMLELIEPSAPMPTVKVTPPGELEACVLQYFCDQASGNNCRDESGKAVDGSPCACPLTGRLCLWHNGVALPVPAGAAAPTTGAAPGLIPRAVVATGNGLCVGTALAGAAVVSAKGFPGPDAIRSSVLIGHQQMQPHGGGAIVVATAVASLRVPGIHTDIIATANVPVAASGEAAAAAPDTASSSSSSSAAASAATAAAAQSLPENPTADQLAAGAKRAEDIAVRAIAALALHDPSIFAAA